MSVGMRPEMMLMRAETRGYPYCRRRHDMYDTVIWATDGSDGADIALDEALRLTELDGGRLVAVHCDQGLNGRAMAWPVLADEDDRRVKIHRQVAELNEAGVDIDIVFRKSHREAPDVVADVATELDADVIVCGTRGLGALPGLFLGSFAQRLLHVAPCPVLVVRERGRRHESAPAPEREETPA
jgi:nucleotide-binding universal stress UspA family protein